MIDRLFLDHLHEIAETYREHGGHAIYIAFRLIFSGLACLIHALVPGLFVHTASHAVRDIDALMARRASAAQNRLAVNPKKAAHDLAGLRSAAPPASPNALQAGIGPST